MSLGDDLAVLRAIIVAAGDFIPRRADMPVPVSLLMRLADELAQHRDRAMRPAAMMGPEAAHGPEAKEDADGDRRPDTRGACGGDAAEADRRSARAIAVVRVPDTEGEPSPCMSSSLPESRLRREARGSCGCAGGAS